MLPQNAIAGILAGGRSRRMGYPKSLLRLPSNKTLIEHVAETTAPFVRQVVLLGPPLGISSCLQELDVWPDAARGLGPLAGLSALLDRSDQAWVLLLACDMPMLSESLLRKLFAHARDDFDAVAFQEPGGKYHSCCTLYHCRLRQVVDDILHQGSRSLQSVLQRATVCTLTPDKADQSALVDVDCPTELAEYGLRISPDPSVQ